MLQARQHATSASVDGSKLQRVSVSARALFRLAPTSFSTIVARVAHGFFQRGIAFLNGGDPNTERMAQSPRELSDERPTRSQLVSQPEAGRQLPSSPSKSQHSSKDPYGI